MKTENSELLYNSNKRKRKTSFNDDKKNRIIKISSSQIKHRINFLSDIKCFNNLMQLIINIFFFENESRRKKTRIL